MRYELELYAKAWTLVGHRPQKRVFFETDHASITTAEQLGRGYAEMRLWQLTATGKEFVCSGAI